VRNAPSGEQEDVMKSAQKTAKKTATKAKSSDGFSDFEKEAMRERAAELKAQSRGGSKAEKEAALENAVLERIAKMPEPDRGLARRLHEIIKAAAPQLKAKLWYSMPAYARDDEMICFFQDAAKFKARYATLGFSDKARLDDGNMWPAAYGITKLTPADEAKITSLVKKAVG